MVVAYKVGHAVSLTHYTIEDLETLIYSTRRLELDPEVAERINEGARFVRRKAAEDLHIYGTNTGFGALCETRVGPEQMSDLQYRHVVSHACGIGDAVSVEVSRLTLFIKLLTFRTGHTGITPAVVSRLLDFWNADAIPIIPKKGTVGASGDLSPLAHLALPLLGLGKFHVNGKIVPAGEVLADQGWEPLTLQPKEGLALTNGVQYINAIGAHALMRLGLLIRLADLIAALSIQAFSCSRTFYQAILHETSLHEERRTVAANLRMLLDGSNHFELPTCASSKQDPYSFRCTPQVHAAVRQAYRFGKDIIEKECNSVSDNPLFFPAHDVFLSGGNLHGESTAMALDFLAIAASELASISERRTYQLLSGRRGLPDFLIRDAGLNSGFMITQYTSAALVNENKVLSTPASVDTIMTCQLQEDHVSMGGTSAYKLCQILDNCEYVLAIELLNAVQAISLNPALRPSPRTLEVAEDFRSQVDFIDTDVLMSDWIESARRMLSERARNWTEGIA
jgi:histidine ammonia-lyase